MTWPKMRFNKSVAPDNLFIDYTYSNVDGVDTGLRVRNGWCQHKRGEAIGEAVQLPISDTPPEEIQYELGMLRDRYPELVKLVGGSAAVADYVKSTLDR